MSRNLKFITVLFTIIFILSAAGNLSNKTKAQEPSKFAFGELVKIKDFPYSQTFKVIGSCDKYHDVNYTYTGYNGVQISHKNIHLLNSLGQEIVIAEFNLEKLN